MAVSMSTRRSLQHLIDEHNRDLTVDELVRRKSLIEAQGLPCRTSLKRENDFVSVRLQIADGFPHLGSDKWLKENPDYHYHVTVGWLGWKSFETLRELDHDWNLMAKQCEHELVVLQGRFTSGVSLCFELHQESLDALGELFQKWCPVLDGRRIHCSL